MFTNFPDQNASSANISKPFIGDALVDGFRDDVFLAIDNLSDFMMNRVKSEHAIPLVGKNFIYNLQFLFDFHLIFSRRDSNK
uniref:Uncharacterized protein n=1 Tax=Rhabditophanes sp. KR3021 TaxID=114890 RepID=A0AC35U9P2_9BILA